VAAAQGADVEELRAMGGAANSRLWTQMKADITGKRIIVPSCDTATTWGAAILAGVGTGLFSSFEQAVNDTVHTMRVHEPNPVHRDVYQRRYDEYIALYESLKDIMHSREEE